MRSHNNVTPHTLHSRRICLSNTATSFWCNKILHSTNSKKILFLELYGFRNVVDPTHRNALLKMRQFDLFPKSNLVKKKSLVVYHLDVNDMVPMSIHNSINFIDLRTVGCHGRSVNLSKLLCCFASHSQKTFSYLNVEHHSLNWQKCCLHVCYASKCKVFCLIMSRNGNHDQSSFDCEQAYGM